MVTPLQEANTAVELYPITLDHHYLPEVCRLLCQAQEEAGSLAGRAPSGMS